MKTSTDSCRGATIDRKAVGAQDGKRAPATEVGNGSAQDMLVDEARSTASVRSREIHDDHGVCDRGYHPLCVHTLLVCLAFGLVGILPDVDHLFEGLHRSSHLPLTVLGGCLLCLAISLDVRYVHSHRVKESEAAEN